MLGQTGRLLGCLWGILSGAAFFWRPVIAPIVVTARPLVSAIAGGLEGAMASGGLNVLGAGFYSIDISKDSITTRMTSMKDLCL